MAHQIFPDFSETRVDALPLQSSTVESTISSCLPESVKQIRRKAMQAVNKGDFIKAIAIFNRIVIHHTASAEDYNNRGLVHLWSGHAHKALLDFNRAISLNPELPAAYNNRANYYAAQGAKESAIADYERTIDLNPFHVRARINRAITLKELGRYDAALDALDEALLFRQMTGEIYAERGRTYHLRGDWNCAIADYKRALKFFPIIEGENTVTVHPRRRQIMDWLRQLQVAA